MLIAAVIATSNEGGVLSYSFTDVRGTSFSLASLGLSISSAGQVFVDYRFFTSLNRMTFPLVGVVRVRDSRQHCRTASMNINAGCFSESQFSLSVAQFNPICPPSIYRFTQTANVSLTWKAPRLYHVGGAEISLASSAQPGQVFSSGHSVVSYYPVQGQDSSQTSSTRVECTIKVGATFFPCSYLD
jgi:hypothetical protein